MRSKDFAKNFAMELDPIAVELERFMGYLHCKKLAGVQLNQRTYDRIFKVVYLELKAIIKEAD